MADKSALDEKLILLIPGPGIEPQTSCTPWIIVAKESHTLTTQPWRQYYSAMEAVFDTPCMFIL